MTRNPNGTLTLSKRDIAIGAFCFGLLGSAVTIGAGAQSVLQKIERKAEHATVERMDLRLTRIEKDMDTIVCRLVPTDTRCGR